MQCSAQDLEKIAADSNYHDLGALPSNGHPYKGRMDKLFIRPFKLPELRLVSRAADLNDITHLIRAVDNCISYPVNDLTIGDFYYILLWLRLYSTPKTPYILNWHCHQPYFVHKETRKPLMYNKETIWPSEEVLLNQYEVSDCDTPNSSTVHQTDVEIVSLPEEFDELPQGFDFPRVSILAELTLDSGNPEMSYLVPGIQWIDPNLGYAALAERGVAVTRPYSDWELKVLAADHNAELFYDGLEINKKVLHGISESAHFFCTKCQVRHDQKLILNALTFFQ